MHPEVLRALLLAMEQFFSKLVAQVGWGDVVRQRGGHRLAVVAPLQVRSELADSDRRGELVELNRARDSRVNFFFAGFDLLLETIFAGVEAFEVRETCAFSIGDVVERLFH